MNFKEVANQMSRRLSDTSTVRKEAPCINALVIKTKVDSNTEKLGQLAEF